MEEEGVPGAEVGVQAMLLQVLEQGASGAVDDALRSAGGAGGEEDEERVVEGKPLPASRQRLGWGRGDQVGEPLHGNRTGGRDGVVVEREHGLQRGKRGDHVGEGVAVAGGEEQLRRKLLEAAEDRRRPHIRGGAGEGGAEGGGGERRDDRFGVVGGDRDHPVAAADAEGAHVARKAPDALAQLAPGQLFARLEQVLGIAQLQIREERRCLAVVSDADRLDLPEWSGRAHSRNSAQNSRKRATVNAWNSCGVAKVRPTRLSQKRANSLNWDVFLEFAGKQAPLGISLSLTWA